MQRKEAVVLLKDLLESCPFLKSSAVSLTPPNANDALSKGFQIHIHGASLDKDNKACLESIIKKHNVTTKQEKTHLIIYKPA